MTTRTPPHTETRRDARALRASRRFWERRIRAEPWTLEAEDEASLSDEQIEEELEGEAAAWTAHDRFLARHGYDVSGLPSFFPEDEKKRQEDMTMTGMTGMNGSGRPRERGREEDVPELGPQKLRELRRQPVIEARVWRSQDGAWVVHKTTITDIRPIRYFYALLAEDERDGGRGSRETRGGDDF